MDLTVPLAVETFGPSQPKFPDPKLMQICSKYPAMNMHAETIRPTPTAMTAGIQLASYSSKMPQSTVYQGISTTELFNEPETEKSASKQR